VNKAHGLRLLAAAPALLVAATLGAQTTSAPQATPAPAGTAASYFPVDIELGYRFVDVSGNERMYRTQVNDRQGVLLRSLLYDSGGPLSGLDFVRVDGADLGAGPAGMLKLAMGRAQVFRLDFSYRHQDFYSALPAFANPFIGAGIVPGQQTYNRGRDIYEANLQILPGYCVTPIFGYTRNDYHGPGTTTYTLGQDEFALNDSVKATDEEFRVGLLFHWTMFDGGVTQGWRKYRENDSYALIPDAGNGNDPGTVLGTPVTATGISRSTTAKIDTPVTSAWIGARLFDRLKLTGSYVHASPDGNASSLETDAGSFVSFQLARFFSGLTDTITSKSDMTWWRGMARAEAEVMPGVDVTGGWTQRSGTLTGTALISSLFQNTVSYAGLGTGDILKVLNTHNSIDRTERLFDASVSARLWAPLAVNAGWSQTHQDVTVTPDVAEIVISGGQGGEYTRTVNTYGAGATFTQWGLTLGVDYRHDNADRPIFRVDFKDRDRWKARAAYAFGDIVRVGANFQDTHAWNNDPDITYNTSIREFSGDVDVTVIPKTLRVFGSAGGFRAERNILELAPQDFSTFTASHLDYGHMYEGGAALTFSRVSLDGRYISLTNGGSLPFTLERVRVRLEVTLISNLSVAGEWWKDKYEEAAGAGLAGPLANYDGNRYYVGLHWKP
jgi:hypothetical protein